MLHVTDALLSLGTLQVAGRSVGTRERKRERSWGRVAPRASTKRELSRWLAKGTKNAGRWRTTGSHAGGRKGLQKSTEALLGVFQSDLQESVSLRFLFVLLFEKRVSRTRDFLPNSSSRT